MKHIVKDSSIVVLFTKNALLPKTMSLMEAYRGLVVGQCLSANLMQIKFGKCEIECSLAEPIACALGTSGR